MENYANESLQSINKKGMMLMVLSYQNELDPANNKVLQEIRKLNDTFSKLEIEISVTKQVNSLLSRRLVNVGDQCWDNAQYSRRKFLDIAGIPSEVESDLFIYLFIDIVLSRYRTTNQNRLPPLFT